MMMHTSTTHTSARARPPDALVCVGRRWARSSLALAGLAARIRSRMPQCDAAAPTVDVCHRHNGGYVEVRDMSLDRWLVLRVAGPHPQVVLFDRAKPDSSRWHAHFQLCSAGRYTLHVRALMQRPWSTWEDNWSTSNSTAPTCAGPWAEGVILQRYELLVHSNRSNVGEACGAGMWSWRTDEPWQLNNSLIEDIQAAPHPNRSSLIRIFSGLRFQEAHAQPLPARPALWSPPSIFAADASPEPQQQPLTVCLLGDSQLRTLTDGMVQLMRSARGGAACGCELDASSPPIAPCPKIGGGASCERPLCRSRNVTAFYMRSNYGTEVTTQGTKKRLGERCGVLLVNSGHWWASAKRKPTPPYEPRTPGSYAKEVEVQMIHLRNISQRFRLPVTWVASNPYPINAGGPSYANRLSRPYDMATCPTNERRFPHLLRGYNKAARQIAEAHGIEYLDTWEVALPLFDLSADNAHYAWGDSPVARPQAARALNWALRALALRLPCLGAEGAAQLLA